MKCKGIKNVMFFSVEKKGKHEQELNQYTRTMTEIEAGKK